MSTPDILAKYKSILPIKVVWGDMDCMSHVNNTKYFYYCETARTEFLNQVLEKAQAKVGDNALNAGLALAETACRFKVAVTYPDDLLIANEVTSIEQNEFHIKHHIYSTKLDLIAAVATARVVRFDYKLGKRAAISADLTAALEEHLV